MPDLKKILEAAEAEKKQTCSKRWQSYKLLLLAANADKLTTADGKALASLASELNLSAEVVQQHAEALKEIERGEAKRIRREQIEKHLAKLSEKIDEWSHRRAVAIAKLDAEGGPFMREAEGLQAEGNAIDLSLQWLEGRFESRFPELLGVEQAPPVIRTAAQLYAERRYQEIHSTFTAVQASLKAGTDRRRLDDDSNDVVTEMFLIAEESGHPEYAASNFPQSVHDDPRKPEALRIARKIAKGKDESDFQVNQRNLWRFAQRIGWLGADGLPVGEAEAEEPVDAEEALVG